MTTISFQQGLLNSTLPSHHIKPLPEYKTAVAKKPKFVFSHYGNIKCLWDVVIILATIYVAIIVPYNAAFYGAARVTEERWETSLQCPGLLTNYLAGGVRDKRGFVQSFSL